MPPYYVHYGAGSVMSVFLGFLGVLVVLAIIVGIILLQVFLSRRESRWPGLVLPAVSLAFSVITVLAMVLFSGTDIAEINAARDIQLERLYEIREEGTAGLTPQQAARRAEMAEIIESRIAAYDDIISAVEDGRFGLTIGEHIARSVVIFVVTSLPTVILLMIYAGCGGGRKRKKALDVMTAQDLG